MMMVSRLMAVLRSSQSRWGMGIHYIKGYQIRPCIAPLQGHVLYLKFSNAIFVLFFN